MISVGAPVWVGTSWKMNKTLAEAAEYIQQLTASAIPANVQPFVLPAHTALALVRDLLGTESGILLGAQNAHWEAEGGITGEISMRMAADAGAQIIEIGHSDRRNRFGESDRTVAAKVSAAVAHGLIPLVCVGEPLVVRQAGDAEEFVASQVSAALSMLAPGDITQVMIAYEPVWAIGVSGQPATPDQTGPVMAAIARVVADLANDTPPSALLYGGSVSRDNAAELLTDAHTDGLFVGRAGWEARSFVELLELCADPGLTTNEGKARVPYL